MARNRPPDELTKEVQAEKKRLKWAKRRLVLAVGLLLLLGCGMLGFGTVVWVDTDPVGVSSISKTSTTRLTEPANAKANGGTTTTEILSNDATTPGSSSIRSEAVAATLFGLGALLVLCGVFFTRITKISFPGGAGVELGPAEQAKLVETTAKVAQERNRSDDPGYQATLYRESLYGLARKRPRLMYQYGAVLRGGGPSAWDYPSLEPWDSLRTSPGDDIIEEAVNAAADRLGPGDDTVQ